MVPPAHPATTLACFDLFSFLKRFLPLLDGLFVGQSASVSYSKQRPKQHHNSIMKDNFEEKSNSKLIKHGLSAFDGDDTWRFAKK